MSSVSQEIGLTVFQGLIDSFKGVYWLYAIDQSQLKARHERQEFKDLKRKTPPSPQRHNKEEPRLFSRVLQCCTLNGFVFGLSIIIFNNLLLPLLQQLLNFLFFDGSDAFWFYLSFVLKATFDSLWVLPLFILSRIVNALWFQDIGTLAYRYSVGRPKRITSLSSFIADNLFSLIIQALFLIQALLTSCLPSYISSVLFHLHMTLLYSLYSFEYKWIQMGWPLHQRLKFIETNWPYFIGFGLPLSLATTNFDFVISGCLFAILFPIFIISANHANVKSIQWESGSRMKRLSLFSLVVWISNFIFTNNNQK